MDKQDTDDAWGIGDEVDDDPEAWRMYSDVINDKQIAWLLLHPEHDNTEFLTQPRFAEHIKRIWESMPSPKPKLPFDNNEDDNSIKSSS